jgi:hypothetical protein
VEFLVQGMLDLAPGQGVGVVRGWLTWHADLVFLPFGKARPRLEGGPVGHAKQPAPHRRLLADRTGPLGQDEERRLKRVFGVGLVAEDVAADVKHHPAVAEHQRLERRFVPLRAEAAQQFQVRQLLIALAFAQAADQLQDAAPGGSHSPVYQSPVNGRSSDE